MFQDLREAIDNVCNKPEFRLHSCVENLRKVSNLYFVEPEDDEEFTEWQEESK